MTAEPRMARSGETWRNAPAPVCEAEMKRLASRRLIVASVLAASKALMRSSVRIHLSACTTMLSCFSRSRVVVLEGVVNSVSGEGSSKASGMYGW